jgi:hypothetical protein
VRIDTLEFEGKMQSDNFIDWFQTTERIFYFKEYPDRKVKLMALKLRKYASL